MSAAVAASGWTVAAGLGALGAVLGRARTSVIGGYPLPGALPRPTSSPFLSIPIKFSIFPTNPVGIGGFRHQHGASGPTLAARRSPGGGPQCRAGPAPPPCGGDRAGPDEASFQQPPA